ncbi:hypothetical protein EJ06DRAFT_527952 [Trichodelitschia bisporula]|uniref:Uncharacterized protein n=1 Tax=Trichodelitschia bisporula TaxID=703511 RepID=A0A6G1I3Y0_9PEZI|nr:hypothetical protein EJ06DRAFT_527952 [Trichodelitschia bisporula]
MAQNGLNPPPSDPEDPFAQLRRAVERTITSAFSFTDSIYQRGSERGRELSQRYQRRDTEASTSNDSSSRDAPWDAPSLGAPCRDTPSLEGPRDPEPERGDFLGDWMSTIMKDLQQGEKRAKEMYEWWQQKAETDMAEHKDEARPERKEWESSADWMNAKKEVQQVLRVADEAFNHMEKMVRGHGGWPFGLDGDDELFQALPRLASLSLFGRPSVFYGPEDLSSTETAAAYLLYSPYSPIHLEREPGFDTTWRNRFEDLLREQNGQNPLSQQEMEDRQNSFQAEWIMRVVGQLRDRDNLRNSQCPITSETERKSAFSWNSGSKESQDSGPESELDMYERAGVAPSPERGVARPAAAPTDAAIAKSKILSTLTNTERYTAPDGSITTKTTLKRRFADGTEETSETVEMTPAGGHRSQGDNPQHVASNTGKGKGWFWSS